MISNSSGDIHPAERPSLCRIRLVSGKPRPIPFKAAASGFSASLQRKEIIPTGPIPETFAKPSKLWPPKALTGSDILLRPFFVIENRIHDFGLNGAAIHLVEGNRLAHARGAMLDQPHRDPAL